MVHKRSSVPYRSGITNLAMVLYDVKISMGHEVSFRMRPDATPTNEVTTTERQQSCDRMYSVGLSHGILNQSSSGGEAARA